MRKAANLLQDSKRTKADDETKSSKRLPRFRPGESEGEDRPGNLLRGDEVARTELVEQHCSRDLANDVAHSPGGLDVIVL